MTLSNQTMISIVLENTSRKTNLEHENSGDEDADDVDDGEQKTDSAENGSFSRHVAAVDELVVVVVQL